MNISEHFRTLKLVHLALNASTIVFVIAGVYLYVSGLSPFNDDTSLTDILGYSSVAYALMSIPLSVFLFKLILSRKRKEQDLQVILSTYRNAFIIRLATLEGAALFALVSFLITGKLLTVTLGGFVLAFMIILRPSNQEVRKEFQLSPENTNRLIHT